MEGAHLLEQGRVDAGHWGDQSFSFRGRAAQYEDRSGVQTFLGNPDASAAPDTEDPLNWSISVLPTPKKSLSFSLIIFTILTQLINTALSNSLFGNYVSVSSLYILFAALIFWHLFIKRTITRMLVDGMLAGSNFSRVAEQDEDYLSVVITWTVVSVSVIVLSGAFRVQAFNLFAKVVFGAFPVLALLAIFTAVGLKGSGE